MHKTYTPQHVSHPAFTLAEIAITLGIVAGTALLTLALFSTLIKNVQRVKEMDAPLRPAKSLNPAIIKPNHPLPDTVTLINLLHNLSLCK